MHSQFVTLSKKRFICTMALGRLSNPPIKEAIISVSFAGNVDLGSLNKFRKHDYIKEHYPEQRNSLAIQVEGQFAQEEVKEEKAELPLKATHHQDGFMMLTSAAAVGKVIQTKIGQLSFHWTEKYDTWESFSGEFKKLWSIFCEVVGKTDLRQMGLRYVNEIDIPLPMEEGFKEYLNLLPQIPEGVNANLNRFFIQVDMPNSEETLNSIVTETFVVGNEKNLKVLLDINVQKDDEFECNSNGMWAGLEEMRGYKNELFERCLTPKTIEMYE